MAGIEVLKIINFLVAKRVIIFTINIINLAKIVKKGEQKFTKGLKIQKFLVSENQKKTVITDNFNLKISIKQYQMVTKKLTFLKALSGSSEIKCHISVGSGGGGKSKIGGGGIHSQPISC